MQVSEPTGTTPQLRFRLLGVRVRVHPSFVLAQVLLAWALTGGRAGGIETALFVLGMLISIVGHELGHALALRRYGIDGIIALKHFGATGSDHFASVRGVDRMRVALAGPLASLAVVGLASVGRNLSEPSLFAELCALVQLLSFCWAALNCLPILFLDGGGVVRGLLETLGERRPVVLTLWLTVLTALAACGWSVLNLNGWPPPERLPPPWRAESYIWVVFFGAGAFLSGRAIPAARLGWTPQEHGDFESVPETEDNSLR